MQRPSCVHTSVNQTSLKYFIRQLGQRYRLCAWPVLPDGCQVRVKQLFYLINGVHKIFSPIPECCENYDTFTFLGGLPPKCDISNAKSKACSLVIDSRPSRELPLIQLPIIIANSS